jgi:probable HAF family extracellular repeat protein
MNGQQRSGGRLLWATGIAWFATVVLWTTSWSQSITWLGTLGGSESRAYGVSPDGRYVVGHAQNASGLYRAFRWDALTGQMLELGALDGQGYPRATAYGVSADGRIVVGRAAQNQQPLIDPQPPWRAFVWRESTGQIQDLGTLGGSWAAAFKVSADGRFVVGGAWVSSTIRRPTAWDLATGSIRDLGTLGGSQGEAYDISADGRFIVGYAWVNDSPVVHACLWDAVTGQMRNLGTLGGRSAAYGVSDDGRVVVGSSQRVSGGSWVAFWWDAASGRMRDLGTFGGSTSLAWSVTGDGRYAVGYAETSNGQRRAFRYSPQVGVLEDLNQTYASLLSNGSLLTLAIDISADGRYIVGQGYNAATRREEAFLLDTWRRGDTNGDSCVDDSDLLAVLFAFGTPGTGQARHGDINRDGIVDDADLLEVLFAFGGGC